MQQGGGTGVPSNFGQSQSAVPTFGASDFENFKQAMKAALFGPGVEGITIQNHGFNVKQVGIFDAGDALVIDGWSGRHISHRRKVVDDDQVKFKVTINKKGNGVPIIEQDVDASIASPILTLGLKLLVEYLEAKLSEAIKHDEDDLSTVSSMLSVELGIPILKNSEQLLESPEIRAWVVNKSKESLNGSWEGVASFLIASIAYYAILKYSVEATVVLNQ